MQMNHSLRDWKCLLFKNVSEKIAAVSLTKEMPDVKIILS